MTSHEFAKRLWDCAPSHKTLTQMGRTEEYARQFRETYNCRPKTNKVVAEGPLVDLVTNYDVLHVEVGAISFVEPKHSTNKTIVAQVNRGPIYIGNDDGLVFWSPPNDLDHVLCVCAASQKNFLIALAAMGCFCSLTLVDKRLYEDEERYVEQATKCGDLAGGPSYRSFWAEMLGCE